MCVYDCACVGMCLRVCVYACVCVSICLACVCCVVGICVCT